MARKRYRPEEIVTKLRQVEVLQSQGMAAADAIRQIGVSEVTFYRWRKEYGGMATEQLKRLKELQLHQVPHKLTGQEQAQAKITAFDIQQNPDSPGLKLHRLDRCRDPDFWSGRVNNDIRILLHKRNDETLLAYVGHHDDAYAWAARRRLDRHPRTGATQIVEIRETVEEIVIQHYVKEAVPKPPLFASETDDKLLSWGIPENWLDTVREATEDTVLDIASHLPDEAQEARAVNIPRRSAQRRSPGQVQSPRSPRKGPKPTGAPTIRQPDKNPHKMWLTSPERISICKG